MIGAKFFHPRRLKYPTQKSALCDALSVSTRAGKSGVAILSKIRGTLLELRIGGGDKFACVKRVVDCDLGGLPAPERARRESVGMAVRLVKREGFLFNDFLARERLVVFLVGSLIVRDPLRLQIGVVGCLRFRARLALRGGRLIRGTNLARMARE
jgi:hypothetical protein